MYDDKIAVFFNLSDDSTEIISLDYDTEFLANVSEFIEHYEKTIPDTKRKNPQDESSNLISSGRGSGNRTLLTGFGDLSNTDIRTPYKLDFTRSERKSQFLSKMTFCMTLFLG